MIDFEMFELMTADALCSGTRCEDCKKFFNKDHCPLGTTDRDDRIKNIKDIYLRVKNEYDSSPFLTSWTEEEFVRLLIDD